jgi:DNA ligase-1
VGDLEDGELVEMQGSSAKPYELRNVGGVYSCSCPAWRNQSLPIEQRTCKHLRRLRGDEAEESRILAAGGTATAAQGARTRRKSGAAASGAPVLLAERWDGLQDPTGWWMSEKLDGVRAYWDGKTFLSRLGNPYLAPEWFVAGLPSTPLDGELWAGRKQFQRAVSIVRRQDRSDRWREITFVVFDAPALDAPFEERLAHCRELFANDRPAHAQLHEHAVCAGSEALRVELARIEALGGEGLMLRKPGSRYVVGRSSTLLKVKSFLDAEACVVEHVPGEGRHEGRLGALVVEAPDGTRFSVGTGFTDAEREAPPPIGTVITYRYQELSTGGVPRFPSFVGCRDDVDLPAPPAPGGNPAAVGSPPAPDKPQPSPPAAEPVGGGSARRFQLVEGASRKFWEIEVNGCELTVRFGRIGSAGQSKTKTFASDSVAAQEAAKLIGEKTTKGYSELGGPAGE